MNYQETIDYLYTRLPVFQNIGARAFKPGLDTTVALCESLGNPQRQYATIHVGGTNGKGSSSHMLAAILQQSGYKVGLYTSPHLKDFRERIRVNGACIDESFVVAFTGDQKSNIDKLNPSFFELTVAMAFSYFRSCAVDVAVIEVGMGGRLDSTNVIIPELSLITNISLDHTQFLGDTVVKIAAEKAGILKPNVPAVISERQFETDDVFIQTANSLQSPLYFGSDLYDVTAEGVQDGKLSIIADHRDCNEPGSRIVLDLTGSYQTKNLAGVLTAVDVLRDKGWNISDNHLKKALASVVATTGLKGRWQLLSDHPKVFCDTAHNVAGLTVTLKHFASLPHERMLFVIGFVSDKDISGILSLFPQNASYYFCQPSNPRALSSVELVSKAAEFGLNGRRFDGVNQALMQARTDAGNKDIIYVGGSTFVVADLDEL